jgi:rod shape determining protein RodA
MKNLLRSAKEYLKKCDLLLLGMAVVISCVGMVAIYSATYSYHRPKFLIVQGAAILIGVCAYFVVSLIDLDRFGDLWPAALVLNLLLLFSLKFLGEGSESTGNNSWIRFGPIGIQPAEIG